MVKTPPEEYYSGEYEIEDGTRHFTPWFTSQEQIVDYTCEKNATIRSLYTKRDGKVYRTFGGQEIDIHAEYQEKVKKSNG